jgi:hypothetical protein
VTNAGNALPLCEEKGEQKKERCDCPVRYSFDHARMRRRRAKMIVGPDRRGSGLNVLSNAAGRPTRLGCLRRNVSGWRLMWRVK